MFLTAFGTFLLLNEPVSGCPHCNIFNYLASSVLSSTNIFHGKVVRRVDPYKAEVEVLKVLRGRYRPGQRVVMKVYASDMRDGDRLIFSDPAASPPTFEVLPVECEDEINFLIKDRPTAARYMFESVSYETLRPKPVISNLTEAVKRVQGISVVTRDAGLSYLARHPQEAVPLLVGELRRLSAEVFGSTNVFFGSHRLAELATALLRQPSLEGTKYALEQIKIFAEIPPAPVNWNTMPSQPTLRGIFIKDLLAAAGRDGALSNRIGRAVLAEYPKLKGMQLADATAALLIADYAVVDSLHQLPGSREAPDEFALGIYLAYRHEARWWNTKKSAPLFAALQRHATRQELRAAIQKEIDWQRRLRGGN